MKDIFKAFVIGCAGSCWLVMTYLLIFAAFNGWEGCFYTNLYYEGVVEIIILVAGLVCAAIWIKEWRQHKC